MAKSRLGKGLGALFPTIPEEKAPDVSRETSAAGISTGKNKGKGASSTKKKATAPRNHAGNTSQKKSSIGKRTDKASSSIPDWSAIAHPSDMFFSNTNEASKEKENRPDVSRETSSNLQQVKGAYLAELKVSTIVPNEHQPRTVFDEDDLEELSDSIKEVGVLQPIVVRKKNEPKNVEKYELIMGERRLRASKLAGKKTIPAIVRTTDDQDMLRDALLENLHRVELNPLEEAAAYEQMIKEFGLTQAQLSKAVSKSRPQIANTLRLLQLPGSVQKRVASGVLSAGHARALLSLKTEKQMLDMAKRIVEEGLSVRSTEELVALQKGEQKPKSGHRRSVSQYWKSSELPQRLGDRFDTKVTIRGTQNKGRIEITFASKDDLQRITNLLVDSKQQGTDGWV